MINASPELKLIFGMVIGFCLWQIFGGLFVRQDKKQDAIGGKKHE